MDINFEKLDDQTLEKLKNLLIQFSIAEKKVEKQKQDLIESPTFHPTVLFKSLDYRDSGFIEANDLRIFLEENGLFLTSKETNLLFSYLSQVNKSSWASTTTLKSSSMYPDSLTTETEVLTSHRSAASSQKTSRYPGLNWSAFINGYLGYTKSELQFKVEQKRKVEAMKKNKNIGFSSTEFTSTQAGSKNDLQGMELLGEEKLDPETSSVLVSLLMCELTCLKKLEAYKKDLFTEERTFLSINVYSQKPATLDPLRGGMSLNKDLAAPSVWSRGMASIMGEGQEQGFGAADGSTNDISAVANQRKLVSIFSTIDILRKGYIDVRDLFDFLTLNYNNITFKSTEAIFNRIDPSRKKKLGFDDWNQAILPVVYAKRGRRRNQVSKPSGMSTSLQGGGASSSLAFTGHNIRPYKKNFGGQGESSSTLNHTNIHLIDTTENQDGTTPSRTLITPATESNQILPSEQPSGLPSIRTLMIRNRISQNMGQSAVGRGVKIGRQSCRTEKNNREKRLKNKLTHSQFVNYGGKSANTIQGGKIRNEQDREDKVSAIPTNAFKKVSARAKTTENHLSDYEYCKTYDYRRNLTQRIRPEILKKTHPEAKKEPRGGLLPAKNYILEDITSQSLQFPNLAYRTQQHHPKANFASISNNSVDLYLKNNTKNRKRLQSVKTVKKGNRQESTEKIKKHKKQRMEAPEESTVIQKKVTEVTKTATNESGGVSQVKTVVTEEKKIEGPADVVLPDERARVTSEDTVVVEKKPVVVEEETVVIKKTPVVEVVDDPVAVVEPPEKVLEVADPVDVVVEPVEDPVVVKKTTTTVVEEVITPEPVAVDATIDDPPVAVVRRKTPEAAPAVVEPVVVPTTTPTVTVSDPTPVVVKNEPVGVIRSTEPKVIKDVPAPAVITTKKTTVIEEPAPIVESEVVPSPVSDVVAPVTEIVQPEVPEDTPSAVLVPKEDVPAAVTKTTIIEEKTPVVLPPKPEEPVTVVETTKTTTVVEEIPAPVAVEEKEPPVVVVEDQTPVIETVINDEPIIKPLLSDTGPVTETIETVTKTLEPSSVFISDEPNEVVVNPYTNIEFAEEPPDLDELIRNEIPPVEITKTTTTRVVEPAEVPSPTKKVTTTTKVTRQVDPAKTIPGMINRTSEADEIVKLSPSKSRKIDPAGIRREPSPYTTVRRSPRPSTTIINEPVYRTSITRPSPTQRLIGPARVIRPISIERPIPPAPVEYRTSVTERLPVRRITPLGIREGPRSRISRGPSLERLSSLERAKNLRETRVNQIMGRRNFVRYPDGRPGEAGLIDRPRTDYYGSGEKVYPAIPTRYADGGRIYPNTERYPRTSFNRSPSGAGRLDDRITDYGPRPSEFDRRETRIIDNDGGYYGSRPSEGRYPLTQGRRRSITRISRDTTPVLAQRHPISRISENGDRVLPRTSTRIGAVGSPIIINRASSPIPPPTTTITTQISDTTDPRGIITTGVTTVIEEGHMHPEASRSNSRRPPVRRSVSRSRSRTPIQIDGRIGRMMPKPSITRLNLPRGGITQDNNPVQTTTRNRIAERDRTGRVYDPARYKGPGNLTSREDRVRHGHHILPPPAINPPPSSTYNTLNSLASMSMNQAGAPSRMNTLAFGTRPSYGTTMNPTGRSRSPVSPSTRTKTITETREYRRRTPDNTGLQTSTMDDYYRGGTGPIQRRSLAGSRQSTTYELQEDKPSFGSSKAKKPRRETHDEMINIVDTMQPEITEGSERPDRLISDPTSSNKLFPPSFDHPIKESEVIVQIKTSPLISKNKRAPMKKSGHPSVPSLQSRQLVDLNKAIILEPSTKDITNKSTRRGLRASGSSRRADIGLLEQRSRRAHLRHQDEPEEDDEMINEDELVFEKKTNESISDQSYTDELPNKLLSINRPIETIQDESIDPRDFVRKDNRFRRRPLAGTAGAQPALVDSTLPPTTYYSMMEDSRVPMEDEHERASLGRRGVGVVDPKKGRASYKPRKSFGKRKRSRSSTKATPEEMMVKKTLYSPNGTKKKVVTTEKTDSGDILVTETCFNKNRKPGNSRISGPALGGIDVMKPIDKEFLHRRYKNTYDGGYYKERDHHEGLRSVYARPYENIKPRRERTYTTSEPNELKYIKPKASKYSRKHYV